MYWDQELKLKILAEALVNEKKNIIQIEKMKRRYYESKKKEVMTKFTDNLIVIFNGNNLPNEIKIYNRLVNLRVGPFIEAVKQCFNCFKFGHIKSAYRAKKKCINCNNCEGSHKPTNRRCKKFIYNIEIKKTMAERNCSIQEARAINSQRNISPPPKRYDDIQ